jgi:hypothetical protein
MEKSFTQRIRNKLILYQTLILGQNDQELIALIANGSF